MTPEKMSLLAHCVSVLYAERNAVTQGTARTLRPLADDAAWRAACVLEDADLLEFPTWENVAPKGQDADWQLTGWTTDATHPNR